jgi:hypothetical protein
MFYARQMIARGAHVVEQNLSLAAAPRQPAPVAYEATQPSAPPQSQAAVSVAPATPTVPVASAAPANPYEPPPRMLAAQQQAASVGGGASATANAAPPEAGAAAVGTTIPTTALTAAEAAAFDSKPAPAAAPRQARVAEPGAVQVLRASTQSAPVNAGAGTADDPIARFANGSY